ncbi:MAG: glycosyltransferase [Saprospiraceae bacterium]
MKVPVLITASSFPLNTTSTKGNFILEFAQELTQYNKVIVLTHRVGDALATEYFGEVLVKRYRFLPFNQFDSYFAHGVLHAFSTYKLLFLFIAPLYFLTQLFAIHQIVKANQIKVIHAHWIIPQGLAAVLYRMIWNRKLKVISTVHGGDIFAFKGSLGTALKRFVLNRIDQLTVVSTHIKNEVEKYESAVPISVLPMGIDVDKFKPILPKKTKTQQTLLFVGRLAEKKGVQYLIAALPEIRANCPNIHLLIAGNGSLLFQLKQQTEQLDLQNVVTFLGNVEHANLPTLYNQADIFIGPSIVAESGDSEGFGLVFAEAAACQTLVVTTDFPAMRDIIINGKTGFTVNQKSATAIAAQVIALLQNPGQYATVPQQARQHVVDNFSWKIIGKKYAILYKQLAVSI